MLSDAQSAEAVHGGWRDAPHAFDQVGDDDEREPPEC
jgi:hypothetical protein